MYLCTYTWVNTHVYVCMYERNTELHTVFGLEVTQKTKVIQQLDFFFFFFVSWIRCW